ncbi:multidrug MFS transporter [candidate division WWE3 bacterium CG_4_9_14_3_um_filter_34_6]|uniref:Multidrug MFS transporter n=1 Tax=candidate division WWE3 bacterium CG_4_9_14_3_um_filter_34_6 TaxID=1975079 RepID=A0A2M7X4W5_UNCKA|nr:MAG: multidrug MFS transporter [candidate division WWE3 bacterium CG_4_9_14_3_um_filter_34_6]
MPVNMIHTFMKRAMDIALSLSFIVFMSPVLIITMILIWVYDRHAPTYTQKRIGLNEEEFNFFKFRSMVVNADDILFKDKELYKQMRSGANKVKDDPRVTPIGKFIRKYSIDEFPQAINVLRGEMSFIGPWALRPDEYEEYASQSDDNRRKLKIMTSVKPGVTGYWQVSGRSNITFDKRINMECEYAKKKSILFDCKILMQTPLAVLRGDGAY